MSVRPEILLLILGCAAVTVVPRILPMVLVNRLQMPHWFLLWLGYVPVAVISALFFREVLLTNGDWRAWNDPYLAAGGLTLAAAFISRSILATVLAGAAALTVLRQFL